MQTNHQNKIVENLLEFVAPTRCIVCDKPGEVLCDDCIEQIVCIDPASNCLACGAPFGRVVCSECFDMEFKTDICLVATTFEEPIPRIIKGYKDCYERRLGDIIADMLVDTFEHALVCDAADYEVLTHDVVVYVPDTARAYRRRGFDHMEYVAQRFCKNANMPLLDALVKHKARDQRLLSREERLDTTTYAQYEVVQEVAGKGILLLDDVVTTGATMNKAAAALKRAGAARVDVLALARVY